MELDIDYCTVLEKIKNEREISKIYEYEMANELDIDERTYRRKEKGESFFTLQEFIKISKKLNRIPAYFFGEGVYNYFYNSPNSGTNSGNSTNSYNTIDNADDLKIIIDALVEKINKINNKEN